MAASETGRLGSHDQPFRREVRPHGGAQPSRGHWKEAFGWNSEPGQNLGSGQGRIEELRPRDAVSDRKRLRPQERRDSFRINRSFGSRRDGTTGARWETAEARTGVTLSLRSKPREGETSVKLPRGFARPPFRVDKRRAQRGSRGECEPASVSGRVSRRFLGYQVRRLTVPPGSKTRPSAPKGCRISRQCDGRVRVLKCLSLDGHPWRVAGDALHSSLSPLRGRDGPSAARVREGDSPYG